jgi:spoIIIJ-associated protein
MANEELKQRALEFAEGLAEAARAGGMDITAEQTRDEPEGVTISFQGADSRWLIGKAGQALDALQTMASLIVNRQAGSRLYITFDADNYRARREATLHKMATEIADQVVSGGQEAVLDPMSALERRIVHKALQDRADIRTYSEGEEPERYLVIAPAIAK